jgi:hypothetical protein
MPRAGTDSSDDRTNPAVPSPMADTHAPAPLASDRVPRWAAAVHAPLWWRWPVAVALGLFTFPVHQLAPAPGVDASWQAGLELAQEQGLHFGRDIVFTYGPLGFLTTTPLFVVWTGLAALAFALLLQVLLCRTLLHVMRDLPGLAAVALAYVIAMAMPLGALPEVGLTIVLAFTLAVLTDAKERTPRWLPAAGGSAAALLLLIKPDTGVLAFAFTAVAVGVSAPRRRRKLAELCGSFGVAFIVLWLATGNAVGDVVPWLRASAQLVSGYTAGMAYEDVGRHYEFAQAGLLVAVMAALVWRVAAGAPRSRQVALSLVWAIGTFALFKEGFVRHDSHSADFFFASAVVAAALARGEVTRIAAAVAAVIASLWALTAFGVESSTLFHYAGRIDGNVAEAKLLVSSGARDGLLSSSRAAMIANLRMPAGVLRDLRSHTVDVEGTEQGAVWTLGLHWRPEPVFQSYAALTPALDRINADFLVSQRAPERVLRLYPLIGVDGRDSAFDAPNAFLALVCNYRETYANGALEVLSHATNRCGPAHRLGGVTVAAGQSVHVPRGGPRELVYARIEIPQTLVDRLRELVWKPAHIPAIVLDGTAYRLLAANASGPLVIWMPSSSGIPPSVLLDAHVNRLGLQGLRSPVTIDFYAVRVG